MTIKYVFAKNAEELAKIHGSAVKSVNKAREQVQIAAVATIKHAYDHGDWTYAQKLVDALGNTINGSALVEWFTQFGGLTVGDEGFIGWKGKDFINENFQKAKDTMWWSLKVKNPYKGFNLEAALQKLIKDANATQEKVVGLTEEDKAKVSMDVSEATIQAVLKLCNFEAMFVEDKEEKAA